VPFLVELATQGPEDVRPPAITSLATLVGQEAAEGLGEAARGAGDRAVRIQALNALAARTEGTVVLQALVSGEGGPRLPWRLRRYARRCLARATRGDR
jgi:hypothetical protein